MDKSKVARFLAYPVQFSQVISFVLYTFLKLTDMCRELGECNSVKISVFDQKKILGRAEDYFLGCVTLLSASIKRHLDGGCKHTFPVIRRIKYLLAMSVFSICYWTFGISMVCYTVA